MKIAEQIAKGIPEAADLCLSGAEPLDVCSSRTKKLWERARALKLDKQVSQILQQAALDELESLK